MRNNSYQPEKSAKKKNIFSSFSWKQLVWLFIGLAIIIMGIIFLIFGLIDDYSGLSSTAFTAGNNGMKQALGGLDFKWFGVLSTILGAFIFAMSLSLSSKSEDRESEKAARREQRLKAMNENKDKQVVLNFEGTTVQNNDK